MSSPIKVGFVGLSAKGWAASVLGPSLIQPSLQSKYELVAVSTTSEASAKASAEKYGKQVGHVVKAYHGDSGKVAADADVDLVVVSVKAFMHKDTILPVIAQKKNFFLEWPAGRGLQDTLDIAEAAKEHGVKTFIGLQARNSPAIKKAKELVQSGAIGPVRSTTLLAVAGREAKIWAPWIIDDTRYALDTSNGVTNYSIGLGHQLDPLTFVLGDFNTVTGISRQAYPTATVFGPDGAVVEEGIPSAAHDHFSFSGVLKSGAIATVVWRQGYKSGPGRKALQWEIHGEDGVLSLESETSAFMNVSIPKVFLNGKEVALERPEGEAVGILGAAWEAYAAGDEQQYADIDDAIRNHRLLDAVRRSAVLGQAVSL